MKRLITVSLMLFLGTVSLSVFASPTNEEIINFLNEKLKPYWENVRNHISPPFIEGHKYSLALNGHTLKINYELMYSRKNFFREKRNTTYSVNLINLDPSRVEVERGDEISGYVRFYCTANKPCFSAFETRKGYLYELKEEIDEEEKLKTSYVTFSINNDRALGQVQRALQHLIESNGGKKELF